MPSFGDRPYHISLLLAACLGPTPCRGSHHTSSVPPCPTQMNAARQCTAKSQPPPSSETLCRHVCWGRPCGGAHGPYPWDHPGHGGLLHPHHRGSRYRQGVWHLLVLHRLHLWYGPPHIAPGVSGFLTFLEAKDNNSSDGSSAIFYESEARMQRQCRLTAGRSITSCFRSVGLQRMLWARLPSSPPGR